MWVAGCVVEVELCGLYELGPSDAVKWKAHVFWLRGRGVQFEALEL